MKNLINIFVLCLVISSCSSSDSEPSTTNNIVGKWTYEYETNYSPTGQILSQYDYSTEPCYHMTTFDYKSSGQMIKVSYDYVAGNCEQNQTRTFNYSVSGNSLIITDGAVTDSKIIEENTSSILKLKTMNSNSSYKVVEYSKVQ